MADGKVTRSRRWCFVTYPESCNTEQLEAIITGKHINALHSPLHDSDRFTNGDLNRWLAKPENVARVKAGEVEPPKVGTVKKPHFHWMLEVTGPSTKQKVRDMVFAVSVPVIHAEEYLDARDIPTFEGPAHMEAIESWSGYMRYLCHLDDDEKHTYDVADVWYTGLVDTTPLYVAKGASSVTTFKDVVEFCDEYQVNSFRYLCNLLVKTRRYDLLQFVIQKGALFASYFRSGWSPDEADRYFQTTEGVTDAG